MVRSMIDKLARMPIAVAVLNTLGCGRMDLVEVDLPEGMSADAFKFQQTSKDNRRGLVVGKR